MILKKEVTQELKVVKSTDEIVEIGIEFFFSTLLYIFLFLSGSLFYSIRENHEDELRMNYHEDIQEIHKKV